MIVNLTVRTQTITLEVAALNTGGGGSGGATVAFSDGTNWRRMADRAIVS